MEYLIIILFASGAAILTFFSGFGLGTILMPVFALFFPVEVAIAMTAMVHLANNLFKTSLTWRDINLNVAAVFAIPAAILAIPGALLLNYLSDGDILFQYHMGEKIFMVTGVKLVVSLLLIVFASLEISKRFDRLSVSRKFLSLGGAISGFFGGLTGHQGALRSLFLLRAGLSKEGFVATGIACAVLIDISRIAVYGSSFFSGHLSVIGTDRSLWMILAACLAAFAGSLAGRFLLRKVALRSVQLIVGSMILIFAVLLGIGII